MSEPCRTSGPRAQSIVALGFSKETRRFLLKSGIKTIDALAVVDEDYLVCNGAVGNIVSEILACLARTGLKRDQDGLFDGVMPDSSALFGEEVEGAVVGVEVESVEDGGICAASKGETRDPLLELQLAARFKHLVVDDFVSAFVPGAELSDVDAVSQAAAKALMLRENRDCILYSSDKALLGEIADKARALYDEESERKKEFEYHFSIPVTELCLSVRARNILSNQESIRTIGDLCAFGEEAVFGLRNAGVGVIENIVGALEQVDPRLVPVFRDGEGVRVAPPASDMDATPQCSGSLEGLSLHEVPLDVSKLSVRARNVLQHNRVTTIGSVLDLGEEGLLRLRCAGLKTVAEILDHAKMQADQYAAMIEAESTLDVEALEAAEALEVAAVPEFPADEIEDAGIRSLLLDLSGFAVPSPLLCVELAGVFAAEEVRGIVIRSLLGEIFRKNPWGLTLDECLGLTSRFNDGFEEEMIAAALKTLADRGEIRLEGDAWIPGGVSIENMVAARVKKPEWGAMVVGRLAGKTYEEIGALHGITRERVRQILNKALEPSLLDGTRPGMYLDLMRHYELNEREVRLGLGASLEEWEAASVILATYPENNRRRLPSEALLGYQAIPSRIRLALEKEVHRGYVKIDGEYIKKRRVDLTLHVLKSIASDKAVSAGKLEEEYKKTLEDCGLSHDESLQLGDRYITETMKHQRNVLRGLHGAVRFYDYDAHDVDSLIENLHFENYADSEISTRIFAMDKPAVLEEYEISDHYELHNLLRKHQELCEAAGGQAPYRVGRRMPMIEVGDCCRERQYLDLARETSPISVEAFLRLYETRYGTEQDTARNECSIILGKHIINGTVCMELEDFTFEEKTRMAELFPGDFYKISSFESAYRREFPSAGKDRLNALSLRNLGFRVYSECILRSTWSSQSDYFDHLVLTKEFFDEGTVPTEVDGCHAYEGYVDELVRERRLLPYGGATWITEKGMAELGLIESDLLCFADAAADFCSKRAIRYCTVASLKSEGFDHELFSFDFDDEFYAALLCSGGTRFSVLMCSRKRIACLDDARVAIASFLEAQVNEGESLAVEDLISRVRTTYGITVKRDKAMYAPARSNLYYSAITDMIYKDRQTFIREVE